MPTTPTLVLCDQLVTALTDAWEPTGDDGAERVYFKRWGDGQDALTELKGRRVLIYPTAYEKAGATRGEDLYEHRITVQVGERHRDPGDPPTAWIDERVDWVYDRVFRGFDFGTPPPWNRRLQTTSAAVVICDVDRLTTGGKVFFSQIDFVFAELRDV